jgi:xanthine dehydrogenase YagR molybdenum-binding subunit
MAGETMKNPIPNTDPAAVSVGKPYKRVDGRLKVTGQARYAAEAPVQNLAYAVIVQSTIAKGEIKSFDLTEATAAPGVISILTPQNLPAIKTDPHGMGERRAPLSDMQVHYAGQHIAVVVADTPERAQHAAMLVKVNYAAEKPQIRLDDPAVDIEVAQGGFSPPITQMGDVGKALNAAGVTTVKQVYLTPVETHNPMEMSATVAQWDGPDRLTVWDATQAVSGTRDALADAFGLSHDNVRVLCPYTGGGFGCKGTQWPHTLLAVAAAKAVGRPVKLVLTRAQMFTSCGHRPPTAQTLTVAADRAGRLVAIRHDTLMHGSHVGDYVESCGAGTSGVLYATPNLEISHRVRRMDVAMPTFMRAPGETPGTFALESAMDELAVALNMDPVQLRLVNHADRHPQSGLPWSSKHLKECYQMGMEKFGWARRNPKPGSMRAPDGRPIGWGMATALYPGMRFPGTARIRLMVDEHGVVRAIGAAATQDLGTGTWTIGTQMTASLVGLPVERVGFDLGDSTLPQSGVSGGSATAAGLAQALSDAANALRASLLKLALDAGNSPLAGLQAHQLILSEGKLASAADPSRSQLVAPLLARSNRPYVEGVSAPAQNSYGPQAGGTHTLEPTDNSGEDYALNQRKYAIQSFGAHFVEVTIDDPVPLVRVTRVVSVMDIGRVLNPRTAHSQVLGGVIMGIGQALTEETRYDPNTARPINANLADYAVPVNPDVHTLEAYFTDIPDLHFNALGCRGVGEIGITGVAAAIANAVYHATGKRIRDLPITPDKLLT